MHDLHTVYNTLDNPLPGPLIIIALFFAFAFVVYGTYVLYKKTGKDAEVAMRGGGKMNVFLLFMLFEFLMLGLVLIIYIAKFTVYKHDKDIYKSSAIKLVEGKVNDYSPMNKDGHGLESFTVNDVEFHYSIGKTVGRATTRPRYMAA